MVFRYGFYIRTVQYSVSRAGDGIAVFGVRSHIVGIVHFVPVNFLARTNRTEVANFYEGKANKPAQRVKTVSFSLSSLPFQSMSKEDNALKDLVVGAGAVLL